MNLAGIVNEPLLKVADVQDLIRLGFVQTDDGSGSHWGISWEMRTKHFWVSVDPCFVVKLARLDPDTDFLTIQIDTLFDLECLVDWVADPDAVRKGEGDE